MEEQRKRYNRLKCTAQISGMMDRFYEDIRRAPSEGRKVCWCAGASPFEILAAQDVASFHTENQAARISAGQEHMYYIDKAEKEGWPTDTCSYTRINVGSALFIAEGEWREDHERYRVPKPDFIWAGNTCPAMVQWAESLRRIFDVPMFGVDCPFIYDDDDETYMKTVEYTKSQLRDFITFIEENTGRPYNWDALNNIVFGRMRRIAAIRAEIDELCKRKPSVMSAFDQMIAMGPYNQLRNKEVVQFYEEMLLEIKDRVKNETAALPDEKYRLMWRGNFPWYAVGKMSRWMAPQDICLATSGYGFGGVGPHARGLFPPDGFGTDDDPLTFIAWNVTTRGYTRTLDFKMREEVHEYVDGYEIDGAILHSPRSCRPWSMQEYDMAKLIEKKYGIPAAVIEADHTDPRYYNEASVDLKLQALIEIIKERKG
jgi:benzoyl-CoA reductase/2-hydroxyglutaryl-CoA dehydratase subunit BcrC/BadD/HgdB